MLGECLDDYSLLCGYALRQKECMKNICYLVLFVYASTMILPITAKNVEETSAKSALISHALQEIKKTTAEQSGVYRVKYTYHLAGDQQLAVSTKIDYSGYRQAPKSSKQNLKDGDVDNTVEVIYKPCDSSRITLVTQVNGGSRQSETLVISDSIRA